jgi:hypothetical protein
MRKRRMRRKLKVCWRRVGGISLPHIWENVQVRHARLQLPSQYPSAGSDIHHKVHTLVEQTEKVLRHCMEQECRLGEVPSLPWV